MNWRYKTKRKFNRLKLKFNRLVKTKLNKKEKLKCLNLHYMSLKMNQIEKSLDIMINFMK